MFFCKRWFCRTYIPIGSADFPENKKIGLFPFFLKDSSPTHFPTDDKINSESLVSTNILSECFSA